MARTNAAVGCVIVSGQMNSGFLESSTCRDRSCGIGRCDYMCFGYRALILEEVQEWFYDDTDAAVILQSSDCHGVNGEPPNDDGNGFDVSRRSGNI